MGVPISNVTRRVVYAASGTGPYAFTFEILANTDIAVYKDDALLTLTTDYTVTIAGNGTGSITLVASPTGATQIAIVGNRTIQRTTDFVTGGDFFANTVNDEMDQQTIFAQQNAEGLQRALSAPQTDPTSINMTLPRAALRANKALGFDANGNPVIADTLGTNRGNWASGTLYYVRDIIKDTTNSNIWQCIVQHTSSGSQPIGTNADVAKWSLLVDAAAAATSATNAAASASAAATSASAASTSASNASSSASTASTQASNASTSATNAASSASAASSSASTASTAATNAGNSATAAATSATNASNSASAASTSASNASSSASAASTSESNASTSATNAANSASTATTQATNASTSAGTATTQATNAASSATAAAASAAAAAASFDAFDDIYLGAKTSNPTLDNDGNALTTGDQYFNTVANELRVWNGSTWQTASTVGGTVTSINVTGLATLATGAILNTPASATLTNATGLPLTTGVTGTLPTANGGTNLTSFTSGGVVYASSSSALATGSALTFDGTNLGVGGTPTYKLDVIGTNPALRLKAGAGFGYIIDQNTSTSLVSHILYENADMRWGVNSAESMRLTSTGLGIGTSSPATKMVVAGTDPGTLGLSYIYSTDSATQNKGGQLTFGGSYTGTSSTYFAAIAGRKESATSGNYDGYLQFLTRNAPSDMREVMRLDSAGNLGLGVTPSAWSEGRAIERRFAGTADWGYLQAESYRTTNAYFNGGWKYGGTGAACKYGHVGGTHEWSIAASGTAGNAITFTQAMTLDANGLLQVGATSPINSGAVTFASTGGTYNQLELCDTRAYSSTPNSSLGFAVKYNSAGSYTNMAAIVGTKENATDGNYSGALLFYTSLNGSGSAERARIDSSGNLLVGATSTISSAAFTLVGSVANNIAYIRNTNSTPYGLRVNYSAVTPNNTDFFFHSASDATAVRFEVRSNGGIANYSGNNVNLSDRREKTNFAPAKSYLDVICSIPVQTFNYIDQNLEEDDGLTLGVVAQDVQAVAPELVMESNWAKEGDDPKMRLSIYQTDLQYALMKALQELKAEFDAYKASHP